MPLLALAATACCFLALQASFLQASGSYPGFKELMKALAGRFPSPAVAIPVLREFPIASSVYGLSVLYALYRLLHRLPLPAHYLLLLLAVALPLWAIGVFKWGVPIRYVLHTVPLYVLCCLAGIAYLWSALQEKLGSRRQLVAAAVFPAIAVSVAIHPVDLRAAVNAGYAKYADHKGAAEYMAKAPLADGDVIMAVDVLQQTYYLGKVDYWLRGIHEAGKYVRPKDGQLLDIYTHTPLVGTGEELEKMLSDPARGSVYIIGSSTELMHSSALGEEIIAILKQHSSERVFVGRDNRTEIRRFPPVRMARDGHE